MRGAERIAAKGGVSVLDMAISDENYRKLAKHIIEDCSTKEVDLVLAGDFSPIRAIILEELLFNDYCGVFLDIIFEDMFSQKKKPILRAELDDFADFLMSDLSPYMIRHYVSELRSKGK